MNKKVLISFLFLSACTISDVYWKPDVGANNVGTAISATEIRTRKDSEYIANAERFSDYCPYLFGVFKLNNDCSPDKIAMKYELKTITEINTQKQWFPFFFIQRTTLVGIPKDK